MSREFLEESEQAAVVQWAATQPIGRNAVQWHNLTGKTIGDFLFMVPNGVYLAGDARQRARQAMRLKAAGFKPGVCDLVLPVAIGQWHSLYIEMKLPRRHPLTGKRLDSKLSDSQREFGQLMLAAGNCWVVAHGQVEATGALAAYIRGHEMLVGESDG